MSKIERHAEAILKAAGSSLSNYTMPVIRNRILEAVRCAYEDGKLDGEAEIYRVTLPLAKGSPLLPKP